MSDELFKTFGKGNFYKLGEILSSLPIKEQERIVNMSSEEFKKWKKEHRLKVYN